MAEPSFPFSKQTRETARTLIENAREKNSVPMRLGAEFLAALAVDLEGTVADLHGRPIGEIGGIGYNVLADLFNDAATDQNAAYVTEHSLLLRMGLSLSASALNMGGR